MPTTHLLARAVIHESGHLLVVQAEGQSHTFLPGGHHEVDEGMEACLCRELREELGVHASVGRYLGAVEHGWTRDGKMQYELNHCFSVDVPSLSPEKRPHPMEEYLTFAWVPIDALEDVALQPPPLRTLLAERDDRSVPWWSSTLDTTSVVRGGPTGSAREGGGRKEA